MWFIGVEVEQVTSAFPPKKNPGSAPDAYVSQSYYEKTPIFVLSVISFHVLTSYFYVSLSFVALPTV